MLRRLTIHSSLVLLAGAGITSAALADPASADAAQPSAPAAPAPVAPALTPQPTPPPVAVQPPPPPPPMYAYPGPGADQSGTRSSYTASRGDVGFTIDGWLGGGSSGILDGNGRGTMALGATALLQYGWLDVGLGLTAGSALFEESFNVMSVLGGVRQDPVPWFRWELLMEGGVEQVRNVGDGLFVERVSGGDVALPYLGGRASLSFLPGRGHHFLIGWWMGAGSTTGHTTVSPTVESCFLGCSIETQTHTVGGPSFATGLRLGAFIH